VTREGTHTGTITHSFEQNIVMEIAKLSPANSFVCVFRESACMLPDSKD